MSVQFSIDAATIIQFVLAIVLPLLVGLVTTKDTSANRKAILLIVFAVISTFLTSMLQAVQSHTTFDLGAALFILLSTLVTSIAMHFGVWKPTGASDTLQAIGSKPATPEA